MAEHSHSDLRLLFHQVRYQNRIFWRTPVAAFFTLFFPLMFLMLFNLLFDETIEIAGRDPLTVTQFYAPALAVFAAASATYTNLTVGTAIARDEGILKRFLGTPLPPWIYLAGRVGSAVWIALLAVVGMLATGALAYDLEVSLSSLPAAVLTFVVGVACFASLGLAMAGVARTGDSAPALANATILPLAFISDVFVPIADPPAALTFIANLFPLKHFVRAFQDAFSPFVDDAAFRWDDLGVMALWAIAGMLLARRFFGWDPRGTGSKRRRRPSRSVRAE
jgi:ABC-2 type transport system permease protein